MGLQILTISNSEPHSDSGLLLVEDVGSTVNLTSNGERKLPSVSLITAQYSTNNVKEMSVEWNGHSFLVIYGKHINGGFFSVPNWGIGGKLSSNFASDVFSNTEYINRYLKNKRAAQQIAMAIAEMEDLDL